MCWNVSQNVHLVVMERSLKSTGKVLEKVLESPGILKSQKSGYPGCINVVWQTNSCMMSTDYFDVM